MKNICITVIMSILLSLAFINIGSTQTPEKPTIRIEPTNYTGRIGSSFDVKISIYDAGEYLVEDTDVYSWQVLVTWSNTVLDIDDTVTFGDFMDVPRIGPWGSLTADAASGQNIVNVGDGSKFAIPGAWGGEVLIQDDFNSETNIVTSQDGNQLTLQNNLAHTYTVAAGGGAYPWPDLTPGATIGPYRNRIMIGQTTTGAPPGVSGSGWLCTLTFYVLSESTTTLDIDSQYMGDQTYITNTLGALLGDEPSGGGDPGWFQAELFKDSGYFILPWDEDFDGDGAIDIFDLSSVALAWGEGPGYAGPEDINGDGYVTVDDLTMVSTKFGIYANA
jgi:hypothetical protein